MVRRMRPNLSANPPQATTKQPLNNALRLTASVRVSRAISRAILHGRNHVDNRLGKQPECQNAHDDTRQQPIVTGVGGCACQGNGTIVQPSREGANQRR